MIAEAAKIEARLHMQCLIANASVILKICSELTFRELSEAALDFCHYSEMRRSQTSQ